MHLKWYREWDWEWFYCVSQDKIHMFDHFWHYELDIKTWKIKEVPDTTQFIIDISKWRITLISDKEAKEKYKILEARENFLDEE